MIYEALQRPTEVATAGERAFYAAILLDAQACARGDYGPKEHATAWWWLDGGGDAALTFAEVCGALQLDPTYIRGCLLEHRDLPAAPTVTAPVVRAEIPRPDSLAAHHEIAAMIRAGHCLAAIADRLGISVSKVSILSGGLASQLKAERDAEIRQLHQDGESYRTLGERYGLSRRG